MRKADFISFDPVCSMEGHEKTMPPHHKYGIPTG